MNGKGFIHLRHRQKCEIEW